MAEMLEPYLGDVLRLRGMYMVPKLEEVIRQAYALGVKMATGADNDYDICRKIRGIESTEGESRKKIQHAAVLDEQSHGELHATGSSTLRTTVRASKGDGNRTRRRVSCRSFNR